MKKQFEYAECDSCKTVLYDEYDKAKAPLDYMEVEIRNILFRFGTVRGRIDGYGIFCDADCVRDFIDAQVNKKKMEMLNK